MEQPKDSYLTIDGNAEAIFKEKSSKFLCYAFHVESEEEIAACLEPLRKRYYDATHHCYAWRLGPYGERFRANDDGEPSSTAGKPILGQLLSREITNCLIVVVRYFGGTKLGVPGLIAAYKESAAAALDAANIVERTVDTHIKVDFSYIVMNDIMRIIKEEQPTINEQIFDNLCTIKLSIRNSKADIILGRLRKVEGAIVEILTEE
ncbi:MAG: YigZ family protein [Alistipes sp.]|nr:YigZ family protein [Alistipes sp.]